MMRGRAVVVNPEATRIRIEVEMSYSDARALIEQLPETKYPGWFRALLRRALNETVEHVATAREVEM